MKSTNVRTVRIDLEESQFLVVEWEHASAAQLALLTESEREVATLVSQGASNMEIARLRGTSPRTVANQLASIMKKLGASSRVEVAARFTRKR